MDEGLVDAAASSSLVATVSSLTNHGTILSLPERNEPTGQLPAGLTPDEAARRVAARSLRLRPTIPTAIGHCIYVTRTALDLVGGFDETFGTGYGEEVDFCQRCVRMGLRHVCADDVFTFHRGGASFGSGATSSRSATSSWWPTATPGTCRGSAGPRGRARPAGRWPSTRPASRSTGVRIGVDATSLGGFWAGTQTVVARDDPRPGAAGRGAPTR